MIDTQAIRTRILHLALQGKLVPQNSLDDSAIDLVSALCKKIKGQSFQNNISQQEIPYDIPDSWVWCHLSDIGTTNIGLTYHPEDVSANGTIVARSSNIVNNKMDYTDLVKVTCPIRDNQFLYTHDILICARNGSKALVGKCAIFEGTPKTVAFGAFMAVFRTPLYRFVYYYFNSQVFKRNFFNDESKQINQVTQNILKKSLIPIPPIQEQERITRKIEQAFSVLDTIDELQAQYADNLTALKSKLIDAAIQGKMTEQLPEDGTAEELYQQIQTEKNRLSKIGKTYREKGIKVISDNDIPYDIPDTWRWVRLGDLTTVITKGSSPSWQGVSYTSKEEGILFVTSENVGNGKMILSKKKYIEPKFNDMHPASILIKGDILTNLVGASIGRTAVYNEDIDNANINQAVCIIRLVEREITNYLLLYLGSTTAIDKMLHGSVDFARANLSLTSVSNLMIPLPPLAEQKRIVQKLNVILPLCK